MMIGRAKLAACRKVVLACINNKCMMMLCLACGGLAVVGVRRILGVSGSEDVTQLWKELMSAELLRRGRTLNVCSFLTQKVSYYVQKVLLCL